MICSNMLHSKQYEINEHDTEVKYDQKSKVGGSKFEFTISVNKWVMINITMKVEQFKYI